MLHAITSTKNNLKLKKARGENWKKGDYKKDIVYKKTEYNFGRPTEKELEIIKLNIKSRAKIERLRVFIFTIIALILIFSAVYFYIKLN